MLHGAEVEPLIVSVLRWVSLDPLATESRAERTRVPWWQLNERARQRDTIDFFTSEAAAAWAALPRDALDTIARQAIHRAWWATRQNEESPWRSTRHPFHREVLVGDFGGLCAAVSAAAVTAATAIPREAADLGVAPAEVPGFLERLTTTHVRSHAEEVVSHYAAIADDPLLLVRQSSLPGQSTAIVQHPASGLRAQFTWDPSAGLGRIHSDPFSVPMIDPDRPSIVDAWENYAGLGIGARIYAHGAALAPQVQWVASNVISPAARGLRRKLHAADPWRWQTTCTWCATHFPLDDATQADLTEHPESW